MPNSLRQSNSKNATLRLIADVLFGDQKVTNESYYKCEVQFDSNTRCVWLVAGIVSYVKGLPTT